MRFRVVVAAAFVAASSLVPLPGRAATLVAIKDTNLNPGQHAPVYDPRQISLGSGATLQWRNDDYQELSIHTVTAYYGASFASSAIDPGGVFNATYTGGTVLYRCLYHSRLDYSLSPPACVGLCGYLHDTAPDLSSPSVQITTPDGFVFTGGVRVDGTASDNRAVRSVLVRFVPLAEVPIVLNIKQDLAACLGCEGPSARWTQFANFAVRTQPPILTLPPGPYRVEATAVDPAGNTASAPPITIYVLR